MTTQATGSPLKVGAFPSNRAPQSGGTQRYGGPSQVRDRVDISGAATGAAPHTESQSEAFVRISSVYQRLTGKKISGDEERRLSSALADGELTRDEFNDIFRAHFTEPAWKAFTGGHKVRSMEDLLYYFKEFEDYSVATGVSFEYFSQCTKVIISDKLTAILNNMPNSDLATVCRRNSETARRILSHVSNEPVPTEREIEESGEDFSWEDELGNLDLDEAMKKRFAKMLAAALLYDLHNKAERQGMDLKDLNLEDPVMARLFGEGVFRKWALEGTSMSETQFKELKKKVKLVKKLRKMLGSDSSIIEKLEKLDCQNLEKVLQMVKEGKGKEEILNFIRSIPLADQTSSAVSRDHAIPDVQPESSRVDNSSPGYVLPPILEPGVLTSTLA